ncbi:hypothetical protein [Flavobacterium frigoris]|jgi:hypothetical protein|uniref:TerB family tellurite resistance protein n=1 Tax=Flavobacterium frigoris (strain PS1) TaxID=1086011 RepID=H7FVJ6_FLAFP|nr:hypothetical protein [Flavobacterium frigoris]EIA07418.1 hypothetical protein HJ01_03221 [Flavobacterium frigoris PS1]|tara:strand:- start:1794 stop:2420 length:627 start_codon:yes stop_codon:yes gene_type:complete
MKKLFLFLLLTALMMTDLYGQLKQRKVLLQQIAALKVYTDYAQKGYSEAKKGLTTIGDFKRGEFNLHSDYFNSLKTVNPKIKTYAKVGEIIAVQLKIIKNSSFIIKQVQWDDLFHGNEIAYIKRVVDRLIENCDGNLEELLTIVTDGELEMKEEERMKRIDALYRNMLENYSFGESFTKQTRLMVLSRAKEKKDLKTSRDLNGINTNF